MLPRLLAALLPLAVLVAGCTAPVPGAEAECLAEPTVASFAAQYGPLEVDWDAVPIFESNGWILQDDAGGAAEAEHAIAYFAYDAGEGLVLRAFVAEVRSEAGEPVGALVHVEAPGSRVLTDADAHALLGAHVLPIERGFAEMLGAPVGEHGYAGGMPCLG